MSSLHGTGALIGPIIRRDRFRLVVWAVAMVALVVITIASTKGLYPNKADLEHIARLTEDSPAAAAFNGPPVALDTMGGQVAFQVGAFGLTMMGLLSVLLTSRFTRGEEDSGRLELVRALPVGHHAPLAAAIIVVAGLDLLVGAATTASLLLYDLPVAGSIALGIAFVAVGWFFVGCTAAMAQLAENPRVASGISGAVLGASYAIRAAGDATGGALSWLSPIGVAQKSRPYGGEAWWPLALCTGGAVALIAAAVRLATRRDFGRGMLRVRPGRAHAAPSLGSPLGLAVRLQRGAMLWWTVGVVAMALVCGSLVSSVQQWADDPAIRDYLAQGHQGSVTDSYLATVLLIDALLCAGAAVHMLLRVRSEETELRTDALLATPVARLRWLGSHLVTTLAGSAAAMLAGGVAVGATTAIGLHDAAALPRLTAQSLVYLPAVWLLIGVGLALVGFLPRAAASVWGMWALSLVLAMFGGLIDVPGAVRWLSPFDHVPFVPLSGLDVGPLAVLVVASLVLVAAGAWALRQRDIAVTG